MQRGYNLWICLIFRQYLAVYVPYHSSLQDQAGNSKIHEKKLTHSHYPIIPQIYFETQLNPYQNHSQSYAHGPSEMFDILE